MNATNLYVSTCRLVMQANADDHTSWADLYRLVPYLRQSLSCTVCGNLLIEPYTPTETNCQHHVCKSCKGGKKKLKPSCSWCKDYDKYIENVQLRILLQCYKKLCEYIISSAIYKKLSTANNSTGNNANTNLLDGTTPTLLNLIQEGAGFADEFRSSRSSSFLLSCVHTNSTSTQTNSASTSTQTNTVSLGVSSPENSSTTSPTNGETESAKTVPNGPTVYSVLYAGSGNKLTIKRKASESISENHDSTLSPVKALSPPLKSTMNQVVQPSVNSGSFKKQTRGKSGPSGVVKTGCRCGNATAVPGKLTCCGQRCACYTDSKPCVDCKCRGCRNPHTADGQKVCNYQLLAGLAEDPLSGPQCVSLTSNDLVTTGGGTVQVVGVYTTQLHNLASAPVLLDANTDVTTLGDVTTEETTSDVDVGI